MSKKYFWLKLKKDFFKRHDIKILEAMPDGHLSVLFYLKLMLESIDHEGALRFSDEVPYSPEMLSVITDTDIEVVNNSLKRLQDLKLLEITQDGTILIDKVKSMTGFETEWAKKKKEYREKKGQKEDKEKTKEGQSEDNVLEVSSKCPHNVLAKVDNVRQEKEIEKELELEKELDIPPIIPREVSEAEKMFNQFWEAYPKKVDKKGCMRKFIKIENLADIFPDIMSALEHQKKSKQWNEENGKFIPHPSTWINQERWTLANEVEERQARIDDVASEHFNDFLL